MSSSELRRGFIVCFFGCLAVFLLPPLANFTLLWRADETAATWEIAEQMADQKAIYGTAVNATTPDLKLELIRLRQPHVIILGSSRALQFRQEMFSTPFSNAGGVMGELVDGLNFLKRMYGFHKPELVILQLDHWWFLDAPFGRRERRIDGLGTDARITVRKVLAPFGWLAEGSLSPSEYLDIVVHRNRYENRWVTYPTLGMQAIQYGRGFRGDGSFLDARAWFDKDSNFQSRNFEMIKNHITARAGNWSDSRPVDPQMLNLLGKIIAFIEENGSSVVVMLAPLPAKIIQHMAESGRYNNVADIRRRLKSRLTEAEYHDFHDPKAFGGNDCEYLNGDHGGDVTSVRMLLAAVQTRPDSPVNRHTSLNHLQDIIRRYRGRSFVNYHPSRYKFPEGDYLQLGCAK